MKEKKKKELGKATGNNVSGLTAFSNHSLFVFFSLPLLFQLLLLFFFLRTAICAIISILFSLLRNFNFSYLFLTTYFAYSSLG